MQRNTKKTRFSNMSKSILSLLGISIVALMLALIFYWETYGRSAFLYENVVVLKDDVKKGTIIEKEMITTQSYEKGKLIKDPVREGEFIVGKEAKHFVPGNTPLSSLYFDNSEVVLDKGYFVAKIPNEWILSVPDSIRRRDKAAFCEVKASRATTSTTTTGSGEGVISSKDLSNNVEKYGEPILTTTVAYIKDQNNKEIVDIGKEDRIDASSKITNIEVIVNSEQLDILKKAYESGSKFVIIYGE